MVRYKGFTFRVRGHTWTVAFLGKDKMPDDWGLTVFETQQIGIRDDLNHELVIQTFWHELTHVALCVLDLEKSVNEEDICDIIGELMLEILPQVPKWTKGILR